MRRRFTTIAAYKSLRLVSPAAADYGNIHVGFSTGSIPVITGFGDGGYGSLAYDASR